VPIGTPSTAAALTPPKIRTMAFGTYGPGTSRTARLPAIAQNPPIVMPTNSRDASRTS
jgi:hypothetical protein